MDGMTNHSYIWVVFLYDFINQVLIKSIAAITSNDDLVEGNKKYFEVCCELRHEPINSGIYLQT